MPFQAAKRVCARLRRAFQRLTDTSASASAPHEGQATESVAPHSVQKRRSARLSWLQDGQRIAACLASGDYHAGRKPLNSAPGEPSALRFGRGTPVRDPAMARHVRSRFRSSACPGDCNGDRSVDVDDLLILVNRALSGGNASACQLVDLNLDKQITVDEIVTVVRSVPRICP